MCSLFFVPSRNNNYNNLNNNMEQNFQGDLTDILRGSANNNTSSLINPGYGEPGLTGNNNWQFSSGDDHHNIGISNNFSSLLSTMEDHHHHHQLHDHSAFGDPFSNMRDPLLHDVQQLSSSAVPGPAAFFGGNDAAAAPAAGFFGPSHAVLDQDVKFRPSCNIFSRMLQINPSSAAASTTSATASCGVIPKQVGEAAAAVAAASAQCDSAANSMVAASPRGIIKAGDSMISVGSTQVEGGCSNMAAGGLQISSPRNPGVKRRKSQAKKVVCIPAPAAANSRASGEVVPSDLWAWRKYGQKPIKGSPYPRGYYRCSSSKGCSARKQVERSRTDPNMLVITYTSEHNHPWPTQRNALAGSTRSQPSKSNANNNASSKASPISSAHNQQLGQKNATRSPKDEPNKAENNDNNNASTTPTTSASVKEENVDDQAENGDDQKLLDDSAFSADHCEYDHHDHDHDVGFGYRPALDVNGNDQDFFAGLGQIEADPLNLLFSQDFSSSVDHHQQHHKGIMVTSNNNNNDTKGLDPYFTMFDWSEGNNNNKQRE